ncbi:MAG TPA: DUF4255 domain-containing protein [bacterium]|nr:DUF4255 domain-containing protein [bacterium]
MIDSVLQLLKDEMSDFLIRLPELDIRTEDVVHLSGIVEEDGTLLIPDNSLGLSVVNIEEERVMKSPEAVNQSAEGRVSRINPMIKLNLFVLVSVNASNYKTGLQYLSGAVRFFQSKNVFTHENAPTLHPEIEKLIVELYTLNFEQQNHLWGALGANYLPSVLYRIRLLPIQEAQKTAEEEPVHAIDITGTNIS